MTDHRTALIDHVASRIARRVFQTLKWADFTKTEQDRFRRSARAELKDTEAYLLRALAEKWLDDAKALESRFPTLGSPEATATRNCLADLLEWTGAEGWDDAVEGGPVPQHEWRVTLDEQGFAYAQVVREAQGGHWTIWCDQLQMRKQANGAFPAVVEMVKNRLGLLDLEIVAVEIDTLGIEGEEIDDRGVVELEGEEGDSDDG